MFRKEVDFLGEKLVPQEAYYGIHTLRALENFPLSEERVHRELVWAIGLVKKACAFANKELGFLEEKKAYAILEACEELAEGRFDDQILIHPLAGGAGTSFNMNVNEVIANRALEILGHPKGRYEIVHPIEDVNLHQSTNDVFPTSVKIAVLRLLKELAQEVALLQGEFQKKEKEFAQVLKVGRTEMQDACPVTLGQEFGAWAEALNRDWWRLNKASERVRQVNLGGTAVGTGLNCPNEFVEIAIEKLREITGLPVAKAENLFEATQNLDALCEVSGFLKTLAANLIKIAGDLRFLSSGPKAGIGEIKLPELQAGSSIMPGKVNPVVPEMVIQVGIKTIAADHAITLGCSLGNLELNPFLPLISQELITSLKLLKKSCNILREKCISGILVNQERCKELLDQSACVITAFSPYLGYEVCAEVFKEAVSSGKRVEEILLTRGYFTEEELRLILDPQELTTPGIAGLEKLKEIIQKRGDKECF
ncbi:MAG TPA: aspartate ammonia-lyase [Thermodesulfobacterium commune]|uniref:Aspartate ammonia-lyase n=1 Tax=Thermodesulfobacterium commune TaxID=1741 RepID=A0A3B8N3B6_9BACT|nr:aspartate ammonia-lyase [Thermodesulfobacterium commune]HCE80343.1 aspartate ammonia-lyase [Thermodesulfobacterium commune]